MRQNKCDVITVLVLVLTAVVTVEVAAQETPNRTILFIGDGVGASYWTAAAFARDHLAVNQFHVMGLVRTSSSDRKVTDSAAAATAFSAGIRTYNGAIGVDPDTVPVETVLEMAKKRGMGTGLVATSRITHATPAAFAAHVASRAQEVDIAAQMARLDVDVLLGGGRGYWDGRYRPDSVDLLGDMKNRGAYVETPQQLQELDLDKVHSLFGLFTLSHMPAAPRRSPTLPQMTDAALKVLDHNAKGFFLMVEGSQPDWRGHGNEPLEAVTAEMLDFDDAIEVGLEYQQRHPETLIVVVADHETGGLAIQEINQQLTDSTYTHLDSLEASYTTDSHTAQMVPLFAAGPGSEEFGGIMKNTRVGQLLIRKVEH
ncbi:MAG: alkaline phosphatase [Gemmatimonadales bacterium]